MSLINATKSYADQMEAIGIVKEMMSKEPSENLHRLAYLLHQMVFRINHLEYEIDDIRYVNEMLIEKKNKEILKLIDRANGYKEEISRVRRRPSGDSSSGEQKGNPRF